MTQALEMMIMMLRVAKVYQSMNQKKLKTLRTMHDWLIYRRAFKEK